MEREGQKGTAMAPPLIRLFGPSNRVYVRAQQIWLILVAHIMSTTGPLRNRLLTYGELAERMGLDRRAGIGLGPALGIIGEYCKLNGLPCMSTLVVSEATGVPGDGVVVRQGRNYRDDQRDAVRVNWFNYRIPTSGTFRQVWEELMH